MSLCHGKGPLTIEPFGLGAMTAFDTHNTSSFFGCSLIMSLLIISCMTLCAWSLEWYGMECSGVATGLIYGFT